MNYLHRLQLHVLMDDLANCKRPNSDNAQRLGMHYKRKGMQNYVTLA